MNIVPIIIDLLHLIEINFKKGKKRKQTIEREKTVAIETK